jgi:hypothetical protein
MNEQARKQANKQTIVNGQCRVIEQHPADQLTAAALSVVQCLLLYDCIKLDCFFS